MRSIKRILSLIMVIVMSVSATAFSLTASAAQVDVGEIKVDLGDIGSDLATFFNDPESNIIREYVTKNGNSNKYDAAVILDYLDQVLAGIELGDTVGTITTISKRLGITIDISSVDGLLQTLDTAKKNQRLLRINGSLELMNMDNWTSGQSRGKTGDYTVLFNLIQVLCDNAELIETVLNGTFTLGTIIDFAVGAKPPQISYAKIIIGDDPYTLISKKLSELMGVERDTLDNMIFNEFLPEKIESLMQSLDKKLDELLANSDVYRMLKQSGFKLSGIADGFTYKSSMYTDELFSTLFTLLWKNGVEGALKTLYSEHSQELLSEIRTVPYLAPFADLMVFDGADTSFKLDDMMDANDAMGEILCGVNGVIRSYNGWQWGRGDNLYGDNLQKLLMYMVDNRTKSADDIYAGYTFEKGNFMSYAMGMAKAIAKYNGYDKLEDCDDLEDVIVKVLPEELNGKLIAFGSGENRYEQTIVIGEASNTYEKVLGDILGSLVYGHLPLYTDTENSVKYTPGSGKTLWEVLNYILNYYLVDLNLGELVGINVTKKQDCFEKIEALPELLFTGVCPHTNAEKFLKTDMLYNLVNIKLGAFISALEKIFLRDTSGDTMAGLLYHIIGNVLKGTVGVKVLTGNFVSLDAILQNDSIGLIVKNFLKGLKYRHDMLPVFDYVMTLFISGNKFEVKASSSAKVSLCDNKISGVYVYYGKYPLTVNKDYKFITRTVDGETKAYAVGMGDYGGQCELPSNVRITDHTQQKKVTKATTAKDGRISTVCANCGVTISSGEKIDRIKTVKLSETKFPYDGKAKKPVVSVVDAAGKTLLEGTDYSVKYPSNTANPGVYTVTVSYKGNYAGASNLKFSVSPDKVTGLKASTSSSGVKLTWKSVKGATGYRIYSVEGGKYKSLENVTGTSVTLKGLTSLKEYTFCVKATAETSSGIAYSQSYSSKVKATTPLYAPEVQIKTSSTKIKLTWQKDSGADGYEIYMKKDGGAYEKAAVVKGGEYTASGLDSATKYYFKVRAYKKQSDVTVRSGYTTKSSFTNPASPKVTVKSTKSGTATVSYNKQANVKGYEIYYSVGDGTYKKLKTTADTSYTVTGLKSSKTYYFKVTAYILSGGEKTYSSFSSTKSIKIK